ncbi:unnamed protein product [Umbelopsis ramanniana]
MGVFEEQKALLAIFEARKDSLACPTCTAKASLKGIEPSPTSFARVQCGNCQSYATMEQIQVSMPEPSAKKGTITPTASSSELESLRTELRSALAAIKRLTALNEKLMARQSEVEKGKSENSSFPHSSPTNLQTEKPIFAPASYQFTFREPTPRTPNSESWAAKAKAHLPARKKPSAARSIAASVRIFEPATGPSGYEYIYLSRNRRLNRSEARSHLRRLGLEPSRLLDISMPTRQVIGLLVHVQYAPKVHEVLTKHGLEPLDFNPTDPCHIADPKHSTLSGSDRQLLANSIHTDRMIRTLRYMRPEVASAVGRYFVDQKWLTLAELATVIPHKDHQPPAVFVPVAHRPKRDTAAKDTRKRRALSISSSDSHHSTDAMTTTQ